MQNQQRVLKIRGCDVRFPYKPYPSQLAMMDKTIQALKSSHNVLLELPTGSGKSMSLLCAAAAWHANTVQELQQDAMAEMSPADTCQALCGGCDTEAAGVPPSKRGACEEKHGAPAAAKGCAVPWLEAMGF